MIVARKDQAVSQPSRKIIAELRRIHTRRRRSRLLRRPRHELASDQTQEAEGRRREEKARVDK